MAKKNIILGKDRQSQEREERSIQDAEKLHSGDAQLYKLTLSPEGHYSVNAYDDELLGLFESFVEDESYRKLEPVTVLEAFSLGASKKCTNPQKLACTLRNFEQM